MIPAHSEQTYMQEHHRLKEISFIAWNVDGWKGAHKTGKIWSEICKYDVIILNETHLKNDEDDIREFENKFGESKYIFVHATHAHLAQNGVTVMINRKYITNEHTQLQIEKDAEQGRWVCISIKTWMETDVILCGVYLDNNEKLRKKWMRDFGKFLKTKQGHFIIGGDFNFVMDEQLDKIGGNKKRGTAGRQEQREWERELQVRDMWRDRNTDLVGVTRTGVLKGGREVKTRIDRWLIADKLEDRVNRVCINKTRVSDHDSVTFSLSVKREQSERVRSVPRDLLDVACFREKVRELFRECCEKRGDILSRHEEFKRKCQHVASTMNKKRKKREKKRRNERNKEITIMRRVVQWTENARISVEKRKRIRRWNRGNELLREAKCEKWMNKAMKDIVDIVELDEKANTHLHELIKKRDDEDERKRKIKDEIEKMYDAQNNDRATKQFFDKTKKNKRKEHIDELLKKEDEKEETTSDIKEMKEIAKKFYEQLWQNRRVSNRMKERMMNKLEKKLNDEEKATLDREISAEEVKKMRGTMKNGKAAGIDGIPVEFWASFDYLDAWLVQVYAEVLKNEKMSESMNTAIIKIIFKKGDRRLMSNYRPIALLTSDYKILAKILAERLKGVLDKLIENDQQGFVRGRDISGNIILVKEIIEYCDRENKEGALILMDFQKAYDRVSREVMFELLERLNFGEIFRKYVRLLYKEAAARIEINDQFSESFVTQGGVRQGCPLSPYLFLLVIELLANEFRSEENSVAGIREPLSLQEIFISLFADDSALMIGDPRNQIVECRNIVSVYERGTGSKLNDSKTLILLLGRSRIELEGVNLGVEFSTMSDDDIEKYLGDLIGHMVSENDRFREGFRKIERISKRWLRENLSLYGKAVVSNVLLIACIKYRADLNPVSEGLKKRLHRLIFEFLWGKKAKIKWNILLLPIAQGGIGLKDPSCMLDAGKIRLVKNMRLKSEQPWVRWMERKLQLIKDRWGISVSPFIHKPTRAQVRELKQDCLLEQTLQIWYELGGTSKHTYTRNSETDEDRQTRRRQEQDQQITAVLIQQLKTINRELGEILEGEVRKREEERRREEEEEKGEWGMEVEGRWKKIERLENNEIYEKLRRKRNKIRIEEMKTNMMMTKLFKRLESRERQFWLMVAHKRLDTCQMLSKWMVMNDDMMVPPICPLCRQGVETWDHMEYECMVLREYMSRLSEVAAQFLKPEELGSWHTPSRNEWRLELEENDDLPMDVMMLIAKARMLMHDERWRVIKSRRRGVEVSIVVEKLKVEMREQRRRHPMQ